MSASEGSKSHLGRVERYVLGIDGLDRLREVVVGADLRFDQLRSGRMKARFARANVGPVTFDSCSYSLPVRSTGRGSSQTVSFVLLRTPATFNGVRLAAGELVVYPPGAEFEGFSKATFKDYVFTVPPDDLARFAAAIDADVDIESLKGFSKLSCNAQHLRRLLNLGAELDRGALAAVRDRDFTSAAVMTCLCDVLSSQPMLDAGRYRRAHQVDLVRKAERLLLERGDEPVTLASICAALEVSSRTLQLAFRSVTGLGPSEYSRTMRLQAARRELLRGRAGTHVSEIALRCGFPHFGRFSVYYRSFFGESPSATLRQPLS